MDLKEICKSESLSVPLALFNTNRTMRTGNKAELASQIRTEVAYERTNSIPQHNSSDSKHIVDGMGLVHKIYTKNMKTFGDFFKAYRGKTYSFPSKHLDVHFDRYERPTPKGQTQQKRKKGKEKGQKKKFKRKAVEKIFDTDTDLPTNMEAFLTIEENKIRLQKELSDDLIQNAPPDKIVTVYGAFEDPSEVRCSDPQVDTEGLESDHVEADSRMVLSKNTNASRLVFVTEDTDFLVIALAQDFGDKQVYIHQRQSIKNSRTYTDLFTDVTELSTCLKNKNINLSSLPIVYALTGCDSVSFLYGIGKAIAWSTYKEFQDLLAGINCENPSVEDMTKLETFLCRLYKDRAASSLNTVRVRTFFTCNKPEEMPLHPTVPCFTS